MSQNIIETFKKDTLNTEEGTYTLGEPLGAGMRGLAYEGTDRQGVKHACFIRKIETDGYTDPTLEISQQILNGDWTKQRLIPVTKVLEILGDDEHQLHLLPLMIGHNLKRYMQTMTEGDLLFSQNFGRLGGGLPLEAYTKFIDQMGIATDAIHTLGWLYLDIGVHNVLLGKTIDEGFFLSDYHLCERLDSLDSPRKYIKDERRRFAWTLLMPLIAPYVIQKLHIETGYIQYQNWRKEVIDCGYDIITFPLNTQKIKQQNLPNNPLAEAAGIIKSETEFVKGILIDKVGKEEAKRIMQSIKIFRESQGIKPGEFRKHAKTFYEKHQEAITRLLEPERGYPGL